MMRDYPCTYLQEGDGLLFEDTLLPVPELHLQADLMAAYALEHRQKTGAQWCILPFCHTVEAEAFGAHIHYGDRKNGPRIRDYVCTRLEELMALPDIDFEKGRICTVLEACRHLTEAGETVLLEITGPFTILNGLIDPALLFRMLRRSPSEMAQVFEKLSANILAYMQKAEHCGVQIISYADPTGGTSIIGPRLAAQTAETFTLPLLRQADRILRPETLLHLCPKTAFALLDTGCAREAQIDVAAHDYATACEEVRGKVRFVGQTCVKNNRFQPNGRLQHLLLTTEEERK